MFNSVKSRFIFIVIISLFAMLVFISSLKFSLDKLQTYTHIDKQVKALHVQILNLRKDEKNFFIRRQMQYQEAFDKDFKTLISTAESLYIQIKELGFTGEIVEDILASAQIYHKAFKNISSAYITRGLTPELGLRAKLSTSAKLLESTLKNDAKAHILLLQMRQAEKRFFSRKDLNFASQQNQYYDLLNNHLTSEEEKLLLQEYQKSFKQSYDLRMKIGIDNSQGYVYNMLLSAQDIQEKIDIGTQKIIPLITQERENLRQMTFIVFSLTALILTLLIASSSRKLSLSFDKFIHFFQEAKQSHSHLDAQKTDFSEFSKLSVYANEMIDARVKAEQELQDLNLHLEERVADGIKEIKELNKEIVDTQKEVVFTMGAIGEARSKETGNHVKRVAQYSYILAKNYGLSQRECDVLKEASPMHDIGKIAIPDSVLNKPGSFTPEERRVIETHADLGHEMLRHSSRELLQAASIVSYEHHEKYNGKGYPRGLKGEDIHIYGRITALADVFDALGSDRCYKKAWEDERIFKMFEEERGEHFDPKLLDCFFDNLDEILSVRDKYKDIYEEA